MESTEKSVDYSKVQHYINIIEDLNKTKEKSSYSSLVKDLLVNFGIRITIKELNELYEPNEEELRRDLEIQYRNVCQ